MSVVEKNNERIGFAEDEFEEDGFDGFETPSQEESGLVGGEYEEDQNDPLDKECEEED